MINGLKPLNRSVRWGMVGEWLGEVAQARLVIFIVLQP